jgi:F-type H+-transporting ATPase subunit beta
MAEATQSIGKVVQVIGPVLDVQFAPENLPELYNAVELEWTGDEGEAHRLVCEVAQHMGRNQVRAVAMDSTDGVRRGMEVRDTGQAIAVPVGEAALGRILNVLGEPVDEAGPSTGRSTGTRRSSWTSSRRRRFSRPGSRSSI